MDGATLAIEMQIRLHRCGFVTLLTVLAAGILAGQTDVEALRAKAEQGDAEAQYALGRAYLTGQGVVQSEVDALNWFAKVAQKGAVALHTAAEKGDVLVAKFLLANGADHNAKDVLGHSPLHATAIPGVEAVAKLDAAGVDLSEIVTVENALKVLGERLAGIDLAVLRDAPSVGEAKAAVAKLLLEHGADVNAANQFDQTPLAGAVAIGKSSVVEVLLAGKADVNISDRWGTTPLDYAVLYGNEDMARVLLANGADPNASAHDSGKTPLHLAVIEGHRNIAEALLANGAEADPKDATGWTPLNWAASEGQKEIVQLLLAHDANIDARDAEQFTPLATAADKGHAAVVEVLLAAGAEIHARATFGRTPLSLAASGGHAEAVATLLANNADVNATSGTGATPLISATGAGHQDPRRREIREG